MERNTVYTYLEKNKKNFFPNSKYTEEDIEEIMLNAPDTVLDVLDKTMFYSITTARVFSIVFGQFGLDRLYIGDNKRGLIKLFTYGGFGVLWIMDIIKIPKACCEKNCEKLIEVINKHNDMKTVDMHNDGSNDQFVGTLADNIVASDDISDIIGNDDVLVNQPENDTRPHLTEEELRMCFSELEDTEV